jgi:hypothetical protein
MSYDRIWHQFPLLSVKLFIKSSYKLSELPDFTEDKSLCTRKVDETRFRRDLGQFGEEILETLGSAPLTESVFSLDTSSS